MIDTFTTASPSSFIDLVIERANAQADEAAYCFFHGAGLTSETLTFRQLYLEAASLAYEMQDDSGLQKRVLLVCKSQRNFVIAFFAVMLAGHIAVPTAVPRHKSLSDRLQLLIKDADAALLIADADEVGNYTIAPTGIQQIDMRIPVAVDETARRAAAWLRPALPAAALALLQYTSGSTGDPKGVAVTHANLMHNCAVIQVAMECSAESAIFTALPLFHDMGLIGGVLESMFVGCTAYCMPPALFVQYPERWLQIISKYKITISGGPNFMYEMAARHIEPADVATCDLSSWRVAFCGAEPIRTSTIEKFAKAFAHLGFSPGAFYPCYGMAESTLFITGGKVGVLPTMRNDHSVSAVNCGTPRLDGLVAIVDPTTLQRLPDGDLGEVWAAGSSVAKGYWRRPELTQACFYAQLAGETGQDFLRTGDLGYMYDGQLYITGRLKDLIIVYGKKYAPQDIEDAAEQSHPALCQSGGAAFSIARHDGERLVLVFELRREWLRRREEWSEILSAIRLANHAAHGVTIDEILFIKPGALPRTSSGKVQRSQCRSNYLNGSEYLNRELDRAM
jgi:acyl-CoA synthetase (AMP-forming)/AMP-acid ligase II